MRYPWDWPTLRKYTTESLQALGGHTSRSNVFEMIKIPNRHWRAPIDFSRAKLIGFVERGFQDYYCDRDVYKQNLWMQRSLEDCQNSPELCSLSCQQNIATRNIIKQTNKQILLPY